MKFIHAADIHLGSQFSGIKLNKGISRDSKISHGIFSAFEDMIAQALEENVDFVLISGDLYNTTNRSPYVEDFIVSQFSRLKDKAIKVFLIRGNHDFTDSGSQQMPWLDNVFEFTNQGGSQTIQTKNNETVFVTGASYSTRHETNSMVNLLEKRSAIADYSIGMYHGDVGMGKGNYAPASIQELVDLNYDYLALGHIHSAQVVNDMPLITYSGSLQGINSKETGDHGYFVVSTDENKKLTSEFYPLFNLGWNDLEISIDTNQSIAEIRSGLVNFAEQNNRYESNVDTIYLKDENNDFNSSLLNRIASGYLAELLNGDLKNSNHLIRKIKIVSQVQNDESLPQIDKAIWEKAGNDIFADSKFEDNVHELVREDILALIEDDLFDPDNQQEIKEMSKFYLGGGKNDEN